MAIQRLALGWRCAVCTLALISLSWGSRAPAALRPGFKKFCVGLLKDSRLITKNFAGKPEEGRFLWLAVLLPHSAPTKKSLSAASCSVFPKPADLPARDITRLKALSLIEEHDAGVRLTTVGRARYLALPNSGAIYEADTPDEFISKMAEFMAKARG